MRPAKEIVAQLVDELFAGEDAPTLDLIERRAVEFDAISALSPRRSIARLVAGAVAAELRKLTELLRLHAWSA